MSLYEYRAVVRSVHDGDTVTADIDLGLRTWVHSERLRLTGINAPELGTPEGKAARQHLVALIDASPDLLTIRTEKDKAEKYGRWLATLTRADGVDINQQMLADGFAVPYDGQGPRT